jgi:hypothetical protein
MAVDTSAVDNLMRYRLNARKRAARLGCACDGACNVMGGVGVRTDFARTLSAKKKNNLFKARWRRARKRAVVGC